MGTFKANERPAALTTYRYTNPLILHIISIHFNTTSQLAVITNHQTIIQSMYATQNHNIHSLCIQKVI